MVTLAAALLELLGLHQNIFHALLDLLWRLGIVVKHPVWLALFSLCSLPLSLYRYNLPVGKQGGSCVIEIAVDNSTAQHLEEYVAHPMSEVTWPACSQINLLHHCLRFSSPPSSCLWYLLTSTARTALRSFNMVPKTARLFGCISSILNK